MEATLKLDQIVRLGRLDKSTVRYILQSPVHLSGMPEGGSAGRHRKFTVDQAMRLAVCAHLVMAGIPLSIAGETIRWLEDTMTSQHIRWGRMPGGNRKEPWRLMVFDSIWLRLEYGRNSIPTGNSWCDLRSTRIDRIDHKPFVTFTWDISALLASFEGAFPE